MRTPLTAAGSVHPARNTGDLKRPTVTVAVYQDYAAAQRAVDFLSDNRFPVERVAIVGTNLRLVEQVVGRLTLLRAALAGMASGAWFGLLVGLLLGIFTTSGWLGIIVVAVLIGALWGAIFGLVAHALTGGRRDFTSFSTLAANEYTVVVDADHHDEALDLLARLPA